MITLTRLKEHLKIELDWQDEDEYLQSLLSAAYSQIENDTGRSYLQDQSVLILDHFEPVIELPLVPAVAIASIEYLDTENALVVMPAGDYRLDTRELKAKLYPAHGTSWPVASDYPESVRITYTVGQTDIPKPIDQAALLLIGHWYANRESVVIGTITANVPMAYQALIQPYRIYSA